MIDPAEVASHYDDLDRFYRDVWGNHVHHGLWSEGGGESVEEATLALTRALITQAGVRAGHRVCDVGCGYGETSRILAREYGASVVGYTVSRAQYQFALAQERGAAGGPRFELRDWLANSEESGSFDSVFAIESSEHMPDLARFFSESHRVLKPGGKLLICAWLSREAPRSWEERHLLGPICSEGRLRLSTREDYERGLASAGFELESYEDVSHRVKRTWTICLQRLAARLATRPEYWSFLLRSPSRNKEFLWSLARMRIAYETGSLRYGIFRARKV